MRTLPFRNLLRVARDTIPGFLRRSSRYLHQIQRDDIDVNRLFTLGMRLRPGNSESESECHCKQAGEERTIEMSAGNGLPGGFARHSSSCLAVRAADGNHKIEYAPHRG